jgi:GntR family transcriptional regulator/MocR family aminotransferase
MMHPVFSQLAIDKKSRQPVYLQIAGQVMTFIRSGLLQAGYRLLSSREMAGMLQVHRRTVVRAYEELLAQGWLESQAGSGTFVAQHIPEIHPRQLRMPGKKDSDHSMLRAGFPFQPFPHLSRVMGSIRSRYHLDDGFPDSRLAPLEELARAYRGQMLTGNRYVRLGYSDPAGSTWLRQELSAYLNETRGLNTSPENLLITRGVAMGLYLVNAGLLKPGDEVVVGEKSWEGANANFLQAGARLNRIPVDEHGLDTAALEKCCRKLKPRLVYLTSHHHYPTTVALRAERRIRLLQLAEQYRFIIFEDDYDYDFHYLSKPLLPLAASDKIGTVLYCGSFTKTISPAFRVGYLVGPQDVIRHLTQLRRIIDRQGDTLLENAMAELLQLGLIQRHLRKSLRIYKARRDAFCELLASRLGKAVEFSVPDGGMAVWTKFDPAINLPALAGKALKKDLYFSDGRFYNPASRRIHATRLGFASSTIEELEKSVEILRGII